MSLKPPKKSDLDNGWMKARRDKPKKIQPEYHLIVTEGTDTEPAYFGAMKDIINSAYPLAEVVASCLAFWNRFRVLSPAPWILSWIRSG